MKRFLKFFVLFGLIILTTGCGSQFKDEATVTIDAEQIILAAIKAKRNARDIAAEQEDSSFDLDYLDKYYDEEGNFNQEAYLKDLYGDNYEDIMNGNYNWEDDYNYDDDGFTEDFPDFSYIFDGEPTPEMIEKFNEFFEYSINFECSIQGDKVKSQKKSFTIPFADFMELENNINFAETEVYQTMVAQVPSFSFDVVVGKRIKANVKMTINMVIKDEDAFVDYLLEVMMDEKSGLTQQELAYMEQYKPMISAKMLASFKEEMSEEESMLVTGTSKEIIVQEDIINELEVVIKINPYDGDDQISKNYTVSWYLNDNERPERYSTTNLYGDSLEDFIYSAKETFDGYVDLYSGSGQKVDKLEIIIDDETKADWLTLNAEQKTELCQKLAKIKDEFKVNIYLKDKELSSDVLPCTIIAYENNAIASEPITDDMDRIYTSLYYTFEELENLSSRLIDTDDDYDYTVEKVQISYRGDNNTGISKEWKSLTETQKQTFCYDIINDASSLSIEVYISKVAKTTDSQTIAVTYKEYLYDEEKELKKTESKTVNKDSDSIFDFIEAICYMNIPDTEDYYYVVDELFIKYEGTAVSIDWLSYNEENRLLLCKDIAEKATTLSIEVTVTQCEKAKYYNTSGTVVIDDLGLLKVSYEITTSDSKLYLNEGELLISVTGLDDGPVDNVTIQNAMLLYGGRDLNDYAEEGSPFYSFDESTNILTIENTLSTGGTYQLCIIAKALGSSTYTNSVTLDVPVENTMKD